MTIGEMKEQLKDRDDDLEVVLFFNAGDDMFYEGAVVVKEAYIDEKAAYCYLDKAEMDEEDIDIGRLKKVIAIVA